MPDYTPDEMRNREFYVAQEGERRKSLTLSLRSKHTEYVKDIPLEELEVRIDATRYVLDTSKIPYRKVDTARLPNSRKRDYLVGLLTSVDLNTRTRSLD